MVLPSPIETQEAQKEAMYDIPICVLDDVGNVDRVLALPVAPILAESQMGSSFAVDTSPDVGLV